MTKLGTSKNVRNTISPTDKEALAIYYPPDPVERAIQDAYHHHSNEWLSMYVCQLMSKALTSLKMFDPRWLDDNRLLEQRIKYFFDTNLVEDNERMIFVTHPLFLRDILENREINVYFYNPVTFLTESLVHYLFKEYPVSIIVDRAQLLACNSSTGFVSIGGLLISEEDVALPTEVILDVQTTKNKELKEEVDPNEIYQLQRDVGVKAAASEISKGVFKIDEHERALLPDSTVWDKTQKTRGEIQYIEPGETGLVGIRLENGTELTIGKQFFDHRFITV